MTNTFFPYLLALAQALGCFAVAQESGNKGVADGTTGYSQRSTQVLIGGGELALLYSINSNLFSDGELLKLLKEKKELKAKWDAEKWIRKDQAGQLIGSKVSGSVDAIFDEYLVEQIFPLTKKQNALVKRVTKDIKEYVLMHDRSYLLARSELQNAIQKLNALRRLSPTTNEGSPWFKNVSSKGAQLGLISDKIEVEIIASVTKGQIPSNYFKLISSNRDTMSGSYVETQLNLKSISEVNGEIRQTVASLRAARHTILEGEGFKEFKTNRDGVVLKTKIEYVEDQILARRTQLSKSWVQKGFKAVRLIGNTLLVLDLLGRVHAIFNLNQDPGLLGMDDLLSDLK